MTKEEFLDEIKKELGFMPYEEVIKAEKYFESYFNGSEADEKVIERFGSPKYAAQNYYRTHVANSNANIKPPKKNGVGIWALIIILILLSPILIPLAIVVGFFAVAIIFGILCIFPFAFFSQLFFIQPLVRTIFKFLFRKDITSRKIAAETVKA